MPATEKKEIITPVGLTRIEETLIEKYGEDIAAQPDRMDHLAGRLITLELAIPGLFATALKLTSGRAATISAGSALYIAFSCWFAALALTLWALFPRRWQVNENMLENDQWQQGGVLGIRDYFTRTCQYKQKRLIGAVLLFFAGIVAAVLSTF